MLWKETYCSLKSSNGGIKRMDTDDDAVVDTVDVVQLFISKISLLLSVSIDFSIGFSFVFL
jgi:hypothetical protein